MLYSPSVRGWFDPCIHDQVPEDVVAVDAATYQALMQAQGLGARIEPGPDGRPIATMAPPRVVQPMRRIAPLAFRRRFGAAIGAITLAASRDMEAGDATLQVMLDDVAAAGYADLDDGPTRAGVQLLVTRGLLTEAQAIAQLADGQPGEEPAR
ncbi:hypothetical protein [Plastoroseomonas hellenica]|uniref:hypothetical protein n=1 Tax=Plastoroseomonas hellenica TaxID=2687306 RepID=UPI001BA6DB41|nr:hypothetical protein [Plastoroseomonas hellenica]MBR0643974.1 hypothetical protein [Plastoroseomonas hellenica]